MNDISAIGNSIADFESIREYINNISHSKNFGVSHYGVNISNTKENNRPNTYSLAITISFFEFKTEEKETFLETVKNKYNSFIKELDFENILFILNKINISQKLNHDTNNLELIYINSQSSLDMETDVNTTKYTLQLIVNFIEAEALDGIKRVPISLKTIQESIKRYNG